MHKLFSTAALALAALALLFSWPQKVNAKECMWIWYAGGATNNYYGSAEAACKNFDISSIGYPHFFYRSTHFHDPADPWRGAKCWFGPEADPVGYPGLVNAGLKCVDSNIGKDSGPPHCPSYSTPYPIAPGSGNKYLIERDLDSTTLAFERFYNAAISNNLGTR